MIFTVILTYIFLMGYLSFMYFNLHGTINENLVAALKYGLTYTFWAGLAIKHSDDAVKSLKLAVNIFKVWLER